MARQSFIDIFPKPGAVELLRVPCLAWNLAGFIDAAINAVYCYYEYFVAFLEILPNDLIER